MMRICRALALAVCITAGLLAAPPLRAASSSGILAYISNAWTTLTRSMSECKTLRDPKSPGASVLYFPADFPIPASAQQLARSCPVRVAHLSEVIHRLGQIDTSKIEPQGLLYLPNPYVVPGGRFNEMYGWDSYFIVRGLLEAGKLKLARGIVENFFFEMEHYGEILNANRTYYLSRSQPPFLTEMVRAVYKAEQSRGRTDRAWLEEGYPFAARNDAFWTRPPHLAGNTGLSRYFDFGEGPVPELDGAAKTYYGHAAAYFLAHPAEADDDLVRVKGPRPPPSILGPLFPLYLCHPGNRTVLQPESGCTHRGAVALSAAFYKGDRSVRESGFDITFKFGPFGASTADYAAVGLNSLLYREEEDLAWMAQQLGKDDEARSWHQRAGKRRQRMNRYFWNARLGLYFDYDFKTNQQSRYLYATTFYPLWAGAASHAQAQGVIKHLRLFDEPGGIVMSRKQTGAQWDYPYGWAPIQLIAVEGLRRYGDASDADRISKEFLSMVDQDFKRDHTIREKYNVVTRSSEVSVQVGYRQNVVGFGWTNGVFLVLRHELPQKPPAP